MKKIKKKKLCMQCEKENLLDGNFCKKCMIEWMKKIGRTPKEIENSLIFL